MVRFRKSLWDRSADKAKDAEGTFTENCKAGVFNTDSMDAGAPLEAVNRSAENQAEDRVAAAGLEMPEMKTNDFRGIWRGQSTSSGKTVAVDYEGNAATQQISTLTIKGHQMQTITKAYETYAQARNAVDALLAAGIPISEISVLGRRGSVDKADKASKPFEGTEAGAGAGLGAAAGGVAGLLTGLGIVSIPGLGPVVAAGWLASTALGAAAGGATGGIVGSLIGSGVPEEHAQIYSEAVRRGGTLVSVQAEDHNVDLVHTILGTFMPLDPAQQGAEYRQDGWDKFDPGAGLYKAPRDDLGREPPLM